MKRFTAFAVIAAATFTITTGSAVAKGSYEVLTATEAVNFADLDLSKSKDAERLYERIKGAARNLCTDPTLSPKEFVRYYRIYQACFETAVNNAVRDVDNVNLTAIHTGRPMAVAGQ